MVTTHGFATATIGSHAHSHFQTINSRGHRRRRRQSECGASNPREVRRR
ncbi:MAG: hypothetical protein QOF88_1260, partial [Mycobacterium sp.]|nr:hypothetical protein [Mycobacterium sp.]